MKSAIDYENNGSDPSGKYFRKKKKVNEEKTYFPQLESGLP